MSGNVEKKFQFVWDDVEEVFSLDTVPNPDLELFENCFYLFLSDGANLTITLSGSNATYAGEELFMNSVQGPNEYILFKPNENTPRNLNYRNLDSNASGIINIIPYKDFGSLRLENQGKQLMSGQKVAIDESQRIIISTPGAQVNQGALNTFISPSTGLFTPDTNISSPLADSDQFGSSLAVDWQTSQFVAGSPNANYFKGHLYSYQNINSDSQLIAEGEKTGDLFGWTASISYPKLAVSSLGMTRSDGGFVSVFEESNTGSWYLLKKLKASLPQFANEFGFSLDLKGSKILVGAPGEDDLIRENVGAAYLYFIQGNDFQEIKLLPLDRSSGDRFGHSVCLNDGIAVIGSPIGDGAIADTGAVYLFEYDFSTPSFNQIAKIVSPESTSNQKFAEFVTAIGDFIFVTAPNAGTSGKVFIYRKSENGISWEMASTIELGDFFSTTNSSDVYTNLFIRNGLLVIGVPNESSALPYSGGVRILYNPVWTYTSAPNLPPFFENSTLTVKSIMEGEQVQIDFNATHPLLDSSLLSWEINSTEMEPSTYEINSSSGEFKFIPPSDFSGTVEFTLLVKAETEITSHNFNINLIDVPDSPIFTENILELPPGTIDENYSYSFGIYDADGDLPDLNLASGEVLPIGLSFDGYDLQGIPEEDGNFSFDLNLSDSVTESLIQTFQLQIYSSNPALIAKYDNQVLINPESLSFRFQENFGLDDWKERMSKFEISHPLGEELKIEVINKPTNGHLALTNTFQSSETSIKYLPHYNFFGTDTFKIRIFDNHLGQPKDFVLTIDIIIESDNAAPVIVSQPVQSQITVGTPFNHVFEIFDAEGDYYSLSFQNLPSWISFDSVRTIRGTPTYSDINYDQTTQFVVSVTDINGGVYSDLVPLTVLPVNNEFPPRIIQGATLSTVIAEDNGSIELELQSDNNNTSDLLWEIVQAPLNGDVEVISQNSEELLFSYTPEGNFSGVDYFEIILYEQDNASFSDRILIDVLVEPRPDPPIFKSQPFEGVLLGKPFTLEIVGFDGDPNDRLIHKILNFPSWLSLDSSYSTERLWTWLYKGRPTTIEDFDIHIELSDGNSSIFQEYTLRVVDHLEDLEFLNQLPQIIELNEDTSWNASSLSVNSIEEIKVNWEILTYPQLGSFTFDHGSNGSITNLNYTPRKHAHGNDRVILRVFDGYSSLELGIDFKIISQADAPVFLEIPSGTLESDSDYFDIILKYEDGDGIDTSDLSFSSDFPSWLNVENLSSSDISKTLRISGNPSVEDIGTHRVEVNLVGKFDGYQTTEEFFIKVNYYNRPPVATPSKVDDDLMEDSIKHWSDFITAEDFESDVDELKWTIEQQPFHGEATISLDGKSMQYRPDEHYSGLDSFIIRVTDTGGINNSKFRFSSIPVHLNILDLEDEPFFTSLPPSDSNILSELTWNDEDEYRYEISVKDFDSSWQGYPQIELETSLPAWATWENLGEGKALLVGSPKWYHEGNYSFSIIAKSGNDSITQDFDLEIRVKDYPPRVRKGNLDVNEKIQVFILEDNHLGEVNNAVLQLSAYNPDREDGDSLGWTVLKNPTSGASINLNYEISSTDDFVDIASITHFNYSPIKDFYGTDRFTLIADEGDRSTEVNFEIHVKSVQDPPVFLEHAEFNSTAIMNDLDLSVQPGMFLEKQIFALDPDDQLISFRLLKPTGTANWLSIKSEFQENGIASVTIAGTVPSLIDSESYALIASDPTGRFTLLSINILED